MSNSLALMNMARRLSIFGTGADPTGADNDNIRSETGGSNTLDHDNRQSTGRLADSQETKSFAPYFCFRCTCNPMNEKLSQLAVLTDKHRLPIRQDLARKRAVYLRIYAKLTNANWTKFISQCGQRVSYSHEIQTRNVSLNWKYCY